MGRADNELEALRSRHRLITRAIDGFYGSLRTMARCAAWMGGAYFAYKSLEAVSGKTTTFGGSLQWLLNVSADRYIYGVTIAFLSVSWRKERKLRQQAVKELSDYPKELEATIDPGRTSSGLGPDGQRKRKKK